MVGDPKYLAWLRNQPCACQPCIGRSEANHNTVAPTYAPGERQPKQLPGKRGRGQKSADYYAFSLCHKHHIGEFHPRVGVFEGWSDEQIDTWQNEMSAKYRAAYEAELAAKGEAVETSGPAPITPVPSSLDAFEPIVAAAEFCSAYDLSAQVEHDLVRLLNRALKAAREGKAALNQIINPGDFVRFRDDATTEGKPIGELFRSITWRVTRVDDDSIELAARYLQSELKMHTLTHKMRHATAEELPS